MIGNEAMQMALRAQRAGLSVVPPMEDGSKRPDASGWRVFQQRPASSEEILRWYEGGRSGVGFVCGAVSGGLELLDFDEHGIYKQFRSLAQEVGLGGVVERIEEGYAETTPNGGHLLYRCSEVSGNTKLAQRFKRDDDKSDEHDTIKTMIETRGEGGYVVVAPSSGAVHPSGKSYELKKGGPESIATITPQERADLHRVARLLHALPAQEPPRRKEQTRENAEGKPGDDYNARTSWRDILEPRGWTLVFERNGVGHWRRPGKAGGVSATTNYLDSALLYVFSTSTEFDAERSYDKFGAYAALNHDGDFSAAAAALRKEGFGESQEPESPASPNVEPPDWSEPIDFTSHATPPRLELESLPIPMRRYVEATAESYEIDTDFNVACCLGVVSAASVKRAEVQVGQTHTETLALHMLPTLGPGERKIVLRRIAKPLIEVERELEESTRTERSRANQERAMTLARIEQLRRDAAKEETAEGRRSLARQAADLEAALPSERFPPELFIDDSTPEAAATALAGQDGAMAVISEEAGSFVEVLAGRYSKPGSAPPLDLYLKGYDGGDVRVRRVGRVENVPRACLSVVLTPQPAVLDRLADVPDFRGRGLLGRMCFVLPESRVGERLYSNTAIPSEVERDWKTIITTLAKLPVMGPEDQHLIRMEGEAWQVWYDFALAVEREQAEGKRLAYVRDWASKHAGRAARIAGLFHLVRHIQEPEPWKAPMCVEDVAAAWAVAEWLTEHALTAFDRMALTPPQRMARRLLAWIRRGRLPELDLAQAHRHFRDPAANGGDYYLDGARVLEKRGFLRSQLVEREKGTRGRNPAPKFDVNPATHRPDTHTNYTNSTKGPAPAGLSGKNAISEEARA